MRYDLTAIEDYCRAEGLRFERSSPDEVRVLICQDAQLCFSNTDGGADTYLGFTDSAWHSHGELMLMNGPDTYVELGPVEVLAGLKTGELLIAIRYMDGEFRDRWIFHRLEKQDFQYFETGESIRIQRADPVGAHNTGAAPRRV